MGPETYRCTWHCTVCGAVWTPVRGEPADEHPCHCATPMRRAWTDCPSIVDSRESAERLVRALVDRLGLGYHPETRFRSYVGADGERLFTPEEAQELEALHEDAAGYLDLYQAAQAEWQARGWVNP